MQYSQQAAMVVFVQSNDSKLEDLVRRRLRTVRESRGLSLAELGERANLSASTVSRIETGRRSLSLEVIVALAAALGISIDTILEPTHNDDVVIRPVAQEGLGVTTWELSRPVGSTIAVKQRIEPSRPVQEPKIHPGHDWFYVLTGSVRLTLGERTIIVSAGEAAEFDCMVPHRFEADDGPAEIISIFDRDGHRAHVHTG